MLETKDDNNEVSALIRTSVRQFEQYIKLNRKIPPEVLVNVNQISEANKLADTISAHLNLKISEKQKLLETTSVKSRLEKVINLMQDEIGVLQVEKKIRNRVKLSLIHI